MGKRQAAPGTDEAAAATDGAHSRLRPLALLAWKPGYLRRAHPLRHQRQPTLVATPPFPVVQPPHEYSWKRSTQTVSSGYPRPHYDLPTGREPGATTPRAYRGDPSPTGSGNYAGHSLPEGRIDRRLPTARRCGGRVPWGGPNGFAMGFHCGWPARSKRGRDRSRSSIPHRQQQLRLLVRIRAQDADYRNRRRALPRGMRRWIAGNGSCGVRCYRPTRTIATGSAFVSVSATGSQGVARELL